MKKIIIFGGSGFIGLNLAKLLLKRNYKVTIFDQKKNNLKHKNLKHIIGNVENVKKVDRSIKGNDYVYNFAGIADIGESIYKPIETVKINILGTINTLESCIKHKIKKYVFASSIYVMSNQGSFYRASKKSCEAYIEEYNRMFNQKFTIIRYGSIYGIEGDKRNGISKIIHTLKRNKKLVYGGTKKAVRKFIHIEDACRSTIDLMKKKFDNKIVYIIGKKSIKIKNLMKFLRKALKINSKIIYNKTPQLGHYDVNPFTYNPPKSIYYFRKNLISFSKGLKEILKTVKNDKN